jgi:hypothetical protein
VVEVAHGDRPQIREGGQGGGGVLGARGAAQRSHRGARLSHRGGHRVVLTVEGGQQLTCDADRLQRRPGDPVLTLMVIRQLEVVVVPGGAQFVRPLQVAGGEAGQRADEPVEIAPYRTVDDLVHAHLRHGNTLDKYRR